MDKVVKQSMRAAVNTKDFVINSWSSAMGRCRFFANNRLGR